ncbi:MAG: class I SAM-dependent methyltransferase [Bacteroidia bacterium]|nr:class I SAM-dependent methyltransferase [Bacteroidia bacterium]MCF8426641.1 class I SAM-dependent methyltransferase [Bacteroidia bacterium]MCF8446969.1 class I SAM-dependent methyltransferase [Bacteroidia bacterium]
MNYFSPQATAERYSKGRPYFHYLAIQKIKEYLCLENRLENALDIACGTGLSTQALLEIATNVYGTDSSKSMLDFALNKENIHYQLANAEKQPFDSNFFNLITVCSGIHWFDIDMFLLEAKRILKSKSHLILYDNFFLAEMEGNTEFKQWHEKTYLSKFPAPKRNDSYNWSNGKLIESNFILLSEEKYNNKVSFTMSDLILYFTTQSNIISSVENKLLSYQEIEKWLNQELSKFFSNPNQEAIFNFGNWIKYLQNTKQ